MHCGTVPEDRSARRLAGAALPSQKLGANAARLDLYVILYNLLSAYKRVGLPEDLHTARPKASALLASEHSRKGRPPSPPDAPALHQEDRQSPLRPPANPLLLERPRRRRDWGSGAVSSTPNRKFKSVAILPLLLRRHTSLKNLKVHVGSIDSKPSPDSIYEAILACVLYRSRSDK